MTAVMDGFVPFFHRIFDPQHSNICTMDSNFPCGQVVKFKDILDEFFFLFVNSTLFTTSIYHHANFFLADLFVFFVRINAQKSQNSISRSR